MKKYSITIFTPTFNRASLLPKLYNSLLGQFSKEFEWLVVDDGSTDTTKEYILKCKEEGLIDIQYYQQENSGKHIAINKGVNLAKGELFFIVDSDDFLTKNAVSKILIKYKNIKNDNNFIGLSGRRGFDINQPIGSKQNYTDIIASALDFRYKYKIKGDMAEIFKTHLLKKYPFPHISNEKFCTESLVWNRISKDYKLLWFSDIIYICKYIEGGLTDNIFKIRKNSPNTTILYYSELEKYNIPIFQKLRANINYWRFTYYSSNHLKKKITNVRLFYSLLGIPLGLIMYLKDQFKL